MRLVVPRVLHFDAIRGNIQWGIQKKEKCICYKGRLIVLICDIHIYNGSRVEGKLIEVI